jgi:hypothetical protein
MQKNNFLQDASLIGCALFVGIFILVGVGFISNPTQQEINEPHIFLSPSQQMTISSFLQDLKIDSTGYKIVLPSARHLIEDNNNLILAAANFASEYNITESIFRDELPDTYDNDNNTIYFVNEIYDYNYYFDYEGLPLNSVNTYIDRYGRFPSAVYLDSRSNGFTLYIAAEDNSDKANILSDLIYNLYLFDYSHVFWIEDELVKPIIDLDQDVDQFNFNCGNDLDCPTMFNQFGEIEFLNGLDISGSRATTGKGLSDLIIINETDIIVDTSQQTVENLGFNVPARLTFYNKDYSNINPDRIWFTDNEGNLMDATILEPSPLTIEILYFNKHLDCLDNDNDGFIFQRGPYCTGSLDCNDNDNTIYPGADEICDGKDNDCDNLVDEKEQCHACYNEPNLQDLDGDGYKEINDCCDLYNIRRDKAQNVNGNYNYFISGTYELISDIDCSDTLNWDCQTGECKGYNSPDPNNIIFNGILNGNGHVVSNIKSSTPLFTYLKGTIQNLGLVDFYIKGGSWIAPFAGNLGNTGNPAKIENVYAIGEIVATGEASGLVARLDSSHQVKNSYSAVKIISGSENKAGLIHHCVGGGIINSYWDYSVSGGLRKGQGCYYWYQTAAFVGKSSSEMKQQSTYIGWDFDNVWAIDPSINNGYPYLREQN